MPFKGTWLIDHLEGSGRCVPEPAIQRFEQELGRFLAMRRCALCQKPLGEKPRRHRQHKMFHPECADFMTRVGLF